jgi:hypothetical protein
VTGFLGGFLLGRLVLTAINGPQDDTLSCLGSIIEFWRLASAQAKETTS